MTNTYEEEINKQDAYLITLFKNITNAQIKSIEKSFNHLKVDYGMHRKDRENMLQVLKLKSLDSFYDLETAPREMLWAELNKIEKYNG